MTGRTHFIGGILTGMTVCVFSEQTDAASIIGLITTGAIGGIYPDIDIPTSKIGAKAKPISKVISKTAGHRGMFHAPLFYVAACFLLCHFYPQFTYLAYSFFGGCMSHLVLDALNVQGIPILWPLKSKLSLMHVKQGGKCESIIRFALLAAILVLAFVTYFKPLIKT